MTVLSTEMLLMTDVDARILKAENAFGLIRKSQLRSLYLYDSVKGSVTSYSIYLLYYTVLNAAV